MPKLEQKALEHINILHEAVERLSTFLYPLLLAIPTREAIAQTTPVENIIEKNLRKLGESMISEQARAPFNPSLEPAITGLHVNGLNEIYSSPAMEQLKFATDIDPDDLHEKLAETTLELLLTNPEHMHTWEDGGVRHILISVEAQNEQGQVFVINFREERMSYGNLLRLIKKIKSLPTDKQDQEILIAIKRFNTLFPQLPQSTEISVRSSIQFVEIDKKDRPLMRYSLVRDNMSDESDIVRKYDWQNGSPSSSLANEDEWTQFFQQMSKLNVDQLI